jgi:FkbM family methyltransferase
LKTISYAILVHNELKELKELLDIIVPNKNADDEVVIVIDDTNHYSEVSNFLDTNYKDIIYDKHKLNNNFAQQKNYLNSLCTKEYIFNLDADELIGIDLVKNIGKIVDSNESDLFVVPRINTLDKLPDENTTKSWGWSIDKKGRINFPDLQMRIYKNNPDIKWKGDVHEKIVGFTDFIQLPKEDDFCIIHNKEFNKQFEQNRYYNYIDLMRKMKSGGNYFDTSRLSTKVTTKNDNIYNIGYHRWNHPYQGNWEEDTLFIPKYFNFLEEYITEGDVVLDIGSQTGNMSVAYSNIVGDSGKVIAFEPNPVTYEVTQKQAKIYDNIDVYNFAVTDKYSVETFHYSDLGLCNGGFATKTERGIGVTGHTIPIPVYTLDIVDFIKRKYNDLIDKISFIKIDAEGFDRFIIPQLKPLLNSKTVILTEIYNGLVDEELEDLLIQIDKLGYIAYDEHSYVFENKLIQIKNIDDVEITSGHNLICIPKT